MGDRLTEMWRDFEQLCSLHAKSGNERPTEYRWVYGNLRPEGRVLDVGCCESRVAEILRRHGYEAYGIDIRNYQNPPFNFACEDIRRTSFRSSFFDQILALSTIEHVGMGCYGNTWIDPYHGDRMAVLEMYRILKEDGTMLITLPYGASLGDYWIRYYEPISLTVLLRGLVWDATYYLKEGGAWVQREEILARRMPSGQGALPNAVVCVKAVKE